MKTIFRVRLTKYKGRTVTLSDGTVISKNDLLVKIHFHNVKLLSEIQKYNSDIKKVKRIHHYVKSSLPAVVHFVQTNAHHKEIKGLIGITSLNRGCKRLGFEPFPIIHPIYKIFKQTSLMPISYLSCSKGIKDKKRTPTYLFMSKNILFQKYRSK